MKITSDFNLADVTTFGIAAQAAWFAEYESVDELRSLLADSRFESMARLHIGGGSNLLFASSFPGLVMRSAMRAIEVVERSDDTVLVAADAGVDWDTFVARCVEWGFYGVENLSHIPGQVGASAVQNVGAYGVEAKDVIEVVEALDTLTDTIVTLTPQQCCWTYRDSMFKHASGRYIVVRVTFRLSTRPEFRLTYGPLRRLASIDGLTLSQVRERVIDIRRSKLPDPKDVGSAGSFFKNPVVDSSTYAALAANHPDIPSYPTADEDRVKLSAAWLIDQAGLKGTCVGGATVWPQQPLVIANVGGATASDVVELCDLIVSRVREMFGVELSPEVNIITTESPCN